MRLFALALPLTAALVLAGTAAAAKPTTGFTGTPQFFSTPSADSIHRDVSLTVTFIHRARVAVRVTATVNGVVGPTFTAATFRGAGSDSYTWTILGTDECFPPLPGDEISYSVQLVQMHGRHEAGVVDEITQTFHA